MTRASALLSGAAFILLVAFGQSSCGGNSRPEQAPGTASSFRVYGTARFENGATLASQQILQQIILLLTPEAVGECEGSSSKKQASSLTATGIDANGAFSQIYEAHKLTQLTDPGCVSMGFSSQTIVTLRLTATADASEPNCQGFCASSLTPQNCLTECRQSGGIRATRRFSQEELASLERHSGTGSGAEWQITVDLNFDELLPAQSPTTLPDLTFPVHTLERSIQLVSRTFSADNCAIDEGCITMPGNRRLLVFDTEIYNTGGVDFEIGTPSHSDPRFEFGSCHGHFHLHAMMSYELLSIDAGSAVLTGSKLGFCLMDSSRISGGQPGKFTCAFQGISSGWADVYDRSLDCQWLDVTGLPSGEYLLRLTVNPDRIYPEANYDNNTVLVRVQI